MRPWLMVARSSTTTPQPTLPIPRRSRSGEMEWILWHWFRYSGYWEDGCRGYWSRRRAAELVLLRAQLRHTESNVNPRRFDPIAADATVANVGDRHYCKPTSSYYPPCIQPHPSSLRLILGRITPKEGLGSWLVDQPPPLHFFHRPPTIALRIQFRYPSNSENHRTRDSG